MFSRKSFVSIVVSVLTATAVNHHFETGVAAQEPITIEYWHINSESFGGPTVKELVAEFESQNPGIRVNEQFQPNSYTGLLQNVQTRLAAQNPPDVAQIGYLFVDYVSENFPIKPINELVEEYDGQAMLDAVEENVINLSSRNGSLIGMSYSLSNTITYYNADMFEQAGLDPDSPPVTWEEWYEAALIAHSSVKCNTQSPSQKRLIGIV